MYVYNLIKNEHSEGPIYSEGSYVRGICVDGNYYCLNRSWRDEMFLSCK